MLTLAAVKEAMMASLRSPADLCDRLGLRPTEHQLEVLERFTLGDAIMDVRDEPAGEGLRASALCTLWRAIANPGSLSTVIGAQQKQVADFMDFLRSITEGIDPALSSVCSWPRWGTLCIGDDPGYRVQAVSNRPAFLCEALHGTIVVLGAGSPEGTGQWVETLKTAEGFACADGVRLIRVW